VPLRRLTAAPLGVSTLYLTAAVRGDGGGLVIGFLGMSAPLKGGSELSVRV
jgi:hypothetical protein